MFPADFICPKKVPEIKLTESPSKKVSSWLTENEKNLNEYDELSILNGSLPKKPPIIDLNVSSEEELLSVSQVDTNSNSHLAPLKYKTDLEVINEHSEKDAEVEAEPPEFKDPYEFISSQKSNKAQRITKTLKRNSKSYGNKRKPLGLDISRLVNEPYVKKKKLEIYDASFQIPTGINDTFDQLLPGNKPSQFTIASKKESKAKHSEDKKKKSDNDILIFVSQNDLASQKSQTTLTDFSSGSDDEWAPSIQKRKQKVSLTKSEKPKTKFQTTGTTRKSIGISGKNMKKEEEKQIIDNMNKTFQEIENHNLVTSSQVMREEVARKDSIKQIENKRNSNSKTESKDDNQQIDEILSPVKRNESTNKDDGDHSNSPGWSRVNHFKEELNNDVHNKQHSSIRKQKDKASYLHRSNVCAKKLKVVIEETRGNKLDKKNTFHSKETPLCPKKCSLSVEKGNVVDKECVTKNNHLHSPVRPKPVVNMSSPEEPVRYLNLSQSQERAAIMNDVVKAFESSLLAEEKEMHLTSSADSKICVSVVTLPDEDENLLKNCIKNSSVQRQFISEKWDQYNSDLNTPVSVALVCSKASDNNTNNDSDAETQMPVQANENIDTAIKSSENENQICSTKSKDLQDHSNKRETSNLQDKNDFEMQIECMDKSVVELKNDMPLNHNNLAHGEGIKISRDQLSCGPSKVANEKDVNVSKPCEEMNPSEESTAIVSDQEICEENLKKGILIMRTAAPNTEKNEIGKLKENRPDHCGRRVHFDEVPAKDQSSLLLPPPCGRSVVFLKAGSCLSRCFRPTVKFLYLGSCKNENEKEYEDHWIIKVSKTFPICHCANNPVSPNFCENCKLHKTNSFLERDETRNFGLQNEENKVALSENKENKTVLNETCDTKIILLKSPEKITINNLESSKKVIDIEQSNESTNISKTILTENNDGVNCVKNIKGLINLNNNKECCESSVVEAQIHVETSTYQDPKINENYSTNSIQNLNVNNPNEEVTKALNDSLGVPLDTTSENNSNSNPILKKLHNPVTQDFMQEVKSDQNPSSCEPSQKKTSDDDIFKSYPNNNTGELPFQKNTVKVSGDIFASEECGVLPYQKPCENASETVIASNLSDHFNSKASLPKMSEKPDKDTFITNQNNMGKTLEKSSVAEKINQNSNVCSADEDIFQSDDLTNCLVPPFQENCNSGTMREISQNSMGSNTNINDNSPKSSFKRQVKSSAEDEDSEIIRACPSSEKSNLGKSSNDKLASDSNLPKHNKDVFKLEERNCRSQSPIQKSPRNKIHENASPAGGFKLNHNNLIKDDSQSDLDTSFEHKISSIGKHGFETRKRVRPLVDSSDDSDCDEKIAKKTNTNPIPINSLKQSVESNLSVNNSSGHKHSNNVTLKNFPNTEDDDYLLNSEELLQRVIDNINEDLGTSDKQISKLKGAKKKISSDSEDDLGCRKLSKSPEYDQQEIMCVDDDDDDVFEDNVGSDEDIIECTPKESGTDEMSIKQISPERVSVSGNVKNDVKKDTSNPVSRKFVLPLSTNSNTKNNAGSRNVVLDPVTNHLEKNSNRKVTSAKMKESAVTPNLLDAPQKICTENTGKKGLNTHLSNSQKRENNIQKTNPDIVHNALPPVSRRKMIFVCSGLPVHFVTIVKKFANDIGAGFSDNFTMSMTHLIVNVDENQATPKTLKYLMAVAAKKWVVSFNWITACISAKRILPEEDFEAIDTVGLDGPRRSRLSSESLFKNVQACFIEPFKCITVDKLQEIFMMCGGMVVDSPEGFSIVNNKVYRFIIVDNDAEVDPSLCYKWITRNRAITLNYDWLVDCVGTHTILPLPSSYAVPFTKEQVLACGIPEHLLDEEDMEVTGVSDIGSQPEP